MKTINFIAILMASILVSFSMKAEASISETNKNYESLTVINQGQWDDKEHSLANLFNTYFADVLNGYTYATSQDLYNALGVKTAVDSWYVGDNAMMVSAFKAAACQQILNITDSHDKIGFSKVFGENVFEIFKGESNMFDLNLDPGQYTFSIDVSHNDRFLYSLDGQKIEKNGDGLIHMIALDITELMQQKYGDEFITSAYLFGWEDMLLSAGGDFDYQDLAYIMVNISPGTPTSTPEPATIAILALAAAGIPIIRKRMRKNSK